MIQLRESYKCGSYRKVLSMENVSGCEISQLTSSGKSPLATLPLIITERAITATEVRFGDLISVVAGMILSRSATI